jgi:hypothetical protein
MNKIILVLACFTGLSFAAPPPTAEGRWRLVGTDKTAPRQLSLHVSKNSISGTLDGVAITRGGVEQGYFWFHVVRDGVDYTYKGQMKAGQIKLHESTSNVHRDLSFAKAQ